MENRKSWTIFYADKFHCFSFAYYFSITIFLLLHLNALFSHIIKSFKLFTKRAFCLPEKIELNKTEMAGKTKINVNFMSLLRFDRIYFFFFILHRDLDTFYVVLRHKTNGICFDLFTIHSSVHTNEEISFRMMLRWTYISNGFQGFSRERAKL